MKAAALLVLLAIAGPALAQSSTTSDGFVPPRPLVCGAAPTAATPYAVVEWPQDFYYNPQFQQPPKPLGLRWCSEPGDRAGGHYSSAPWTPCAAEGGRCVPPAFPAAVIYTTGEPTEKTKPPLRSWSAPIKVVSGSIACTNGAFGRDPMYGVVKACWFRLFALEAPTDAPPPGAGYQVGDYFFTR